MSAYVVEKYVIDYVLSAYKEMCGPSARIYFGCKIDGEYSVELPWGDNEALSKVGREILSENVKSVSYRYNDRSNDPEPAYRFKQHRAVYDAQRAELVVQCLNAIKYIEYQSCEHPEWRGSKAQVMLNSMAREVAGKFPHEAKEEWGAPPHLPEGEGPISISDMIMSKSA